MHNEAHIVREWVEIHLREGFEHFFLVDHGSTDNWLEEVSDFVRQGLISVTVLEPSAGDVDQLRARHSEEALSQSEWLLIQDLDEFAYSRTGRSIKEYLDALPARVHQVCVPWVVFGTGGNKFQPRRVVSGCLRSESMAARAGYRGEQHPWHVKSIVRSQFVKQVKVHIHFVSGVTVAATADPREVSDRFFIPNEWASNLGDFMILQNHYIHQSLEFYQRKMQRKGYPLIERGEVAGYTMERFLREDGRLSAVVNEDLWLKHREFYQ